MSLPFDIKSPQIDGPLMSNEIRLLKTRVDELWKMNIGSYHAWHWPDPDQAPTMYLTDTSYHEATYYAGLNTIMQMPWYLQENFEHLKIKLVLGIAKPDTGFLIKMTSNPMKDPLGSAVTSEAFPFRAVSTAPPGRWTETIDYYIGTSYVVLTPDVGDNRTMHLTVSVKREDLSTGVVNTSENQQVKIYSISVKDVK